MRRHRIALATTTAALLLMGSAGAAVADNHMPAPPRGTAHTEAPAGSAGAPGQSGPTTRG
ncbi:hypothetical protein ABT354_17585 [Streptomyces sp. NPDC000594]|uniref:hypothetical protein n=1 Tax=Streptomyces sp. NPDC000594 TaxID=3154261 RepID=UPI00332142B5